MKNGIKYLTKNVYSFICNSGFVAAMTLITVVAASIIINFSYGLYQNYNIIIEEDVGGETGINIYFDTSLTDEGEYINKTDFLECIYEIAGYEDKLDEKFNVIAAHGYIEESKFDFHFNIKNNDIGVSDEFLKNIKANGLFTSGMWWSDEDERLGNHVAVCYDRTKYDGESPLLDKIQKDENTLSIAGEEYDITGYQLWTNDGAMIPIKTAPDNTKMIDVYLGFDRGVTKTTYNKISDTFIRRFGDKVYVEEMETIDKDSYYTYKTIILIAVLIACIAEMNFLILYRYIIEKRNKRIAIYRLCGMSKIKNNVISFIECMIYTIPLYVVGTISFDKLILPRMGGYFPYMEGAYSNTLYVMLFIIYTIISVMTCICMIAVSYRKSIINQLKG